MKSETRWAQKGWFKPSAKPSKPERGFRSTSSSSIERKIVGLPTPAEISSAEPKARNVSHRKSQKFGCNERLSELSEPSVTELRTNQRTRLPQREVRPIDGQPARLQLQCSRHTRSQQQPAVSSQQPATSSQSGQSIIRATKASTDQQTPGLYVRCKQQYVLNKIK